MPATTELQPAAGTTIVSAGSASLLKEARQHLEALDHFLEEQMAGFEPQLRDVARYALASRGKRIRPTLVFFSGWPEDGRVLMDHVRAAAVVELIHLATLVHDDVLDGASLRHQSPTVVRKFSAHVAVLLGDALFAQALKLASDFPTVEMCRAVSLSTRRVCAGEIHQTLERGNPEFSPAEYYEVISLKTGELFAVSCLLGARLGGYPDAFAQAARHFGLQLGIAYQIFDDMADFYGDEEKIGKTLGTDLASGKFTLPLLLLLERLPEPEAAALRREVTEGKANFRDVVARMASVGVFQTVRARFEAELHTGEILLAEWESLPPVRRLQGLAGYVRGQMARIAE